MFSALREVSADFTSKWDCCLIFEETGLLCRPWGVSSTSSSRTGEEALCLCFSCPLLLPSNVFSCQPMLLISGAIQRLLDTGLNLHTDLCARCLLSEFSSVFHASV